MKSYAYVIEDKSIDENGIVRNKFYVGKSNNPQRRFKDKEPLLANIVHQADIISTKQEKE